MSNLYPSENPGPSTVAVSSTNSHAYSPPASGVDKRQIGPVTTAASGGVAAAGIICWGVEQIWHVPVPGDIQTYLGILLVIGAGWLVKPKGVHAA